MKIVSTLIYFTLLISITSSVGFGSSGQDSHGIESGVPKVVFYQAINVAIILISAIYFGRKKISDFFHQKKTVFLEAQQKAQSALKLAEAEHHDVKTRLEKLIGNKSESLTKAKTDAADIRAQLLSDAQMLAKKLKEEAVLTSRIEVERAKYHLKEQLIKEAFELSKRDLSAKATTDEQKKLQQDFITKVQVVQ